MFRVVVHVYERNLSVPNKTLALASGEELHRNFMGRGSPRKSKPATGLISGEPDPILWLQRVKLKKSLKIATINKRLHNLELARNKRFKKKTFIPCYRRYLEYYGAHFGLIKNFAYTAKPAVIVQPTRFFYELSIGLVPICCFTDGGEAYETCQALRHNGFESADILQIDLASQVKESTNVFSSR